MCGHLIDVQCSSASPQDPDRMLRRRALSVMCQNRTCLKPRVASRFWQTLRPGTSHDHGWAAKIAGAFSFARSRCLVAIGGRTGDAEIPRGED